MTGKIYIKLLIASIKLSNLSGFLWNHSILQKYWPIMAAPVESVAPPALKGEKGEWNRRKGVLEHAQMVRWSIVESVTSRVRPQCWDFRLTVDSCSHKSEETAVLRRQRRRFTFLWFLCFLLKLIRRKEGRKEGAPLLYKPTAFWWHGDLKAEG